MGKMGDLALQHDEASCQECGLPMGAYSPNCTINGNHDLQYEPDCVSCVGVHTCNRAKAQ